MYHVLYCVNEPFAQHCAVSMVSLAVNNPNRQVSITVIGMGLSESTTQRLQHCLDPYLGFHVTVHQARNDLLENCPQIGVYPKDIYLRFWVDAFFPPDIERVLYLDADTIVVDDIAPLWQVDMTNKVIAAVDIPEATSHHRCHLPPQYGYFNSGVLLFNVPLWREQNCRQKALDFVTTNRDIAKNPDQDALNGCFYDQRVTLDYRFNVISPFFRRHAYKDLNTRKQDTVRNAVIVHFNGGARPWLFGCNHPYRNKYMRYLRLTPWHHFRPDDQSLTTLLKKIMRRLLRMEAFVYLPVTKGR